MTHSGVVDAVFVIEIECKSATEDELRSVRETSRRRIPPSTNHSRFSTRTIIEFRARANLPGRSQVDSSNILPNLASTIWLGSKQSDAHQPILIIVKVVFRITAIINKSAITKPSPAFKIVNVVNRKECGSFRYIERITYQRRNYWFSMLEL